MHRAAIEDRYYEVVYRTAQLGLTLESGPSDDALPVVVRATHEGWKGGEPAAGHLLYKVGGTRIAVVDFHNVKVERQIQVARIHT